MRQRRRAYADPSPGRPGWRQLRGGDRIVGAYSLSEATPLKRAGFTVRDSTFADAASYKDWVFAFVRRRGKTVPGAPGAPSAPVSNPPSNRTGLQRGTPS